MFLDCLNNLNDFIIEQKKISRNFYRKWASGTLEIFGSEAPTTSTQEHQVIFPIEFFNTEYLVFTQYGGTVLIYSIIIDKQPNSFKVLTSSSTSSLGNYYAIGRWK